MSRSRVRTPAAAAGPATRRGACRSVVARRARGTRRSTRPSGSCRWSAGRGSGGTRRAGSYRRGRGSVKPASPAAPCRALPARTAGAPARTTSAEHRPVRRHPRRRAPRGPCPRPACGALPRPRRGCGRPTPERRSRFDRSRIGSLESPPSGCPPWPCPTAVNSVPSWASVRLPYPVEPTAIAWRLTRKPCEAVPKARPPDGPSKARRGGVYGDGDRIQPTYSRTRPRRLPYPGRTRRAVGSVPRGTTGSGRRCRAGRRGQGPRRVPPTARVPGSDADAQEQAAGCLRRADGPRWAGGRDVPGLVGQPRRGMVRVAR